MALWKGLFPWPFVNIRSKRQGRLFLSALHLSSLINIFKFSQFQLKTFHQWGRGKGKRFVAACLRKKLNSSQWQGECWQRSELFILLGKSYKEWHKEASICSLVHHTGEEPDNRCMQQRDLVPGAGPWCVLIQRQSGTHLSSSVISIKEVESEMAQC